MLINYILRVECREDYLQFKLEIWIQCVPLAFSKRKDGSRPAFIPVMGIEAEGGKGAVEWIKFMDSLKEMDYVSVKDDLG